MTTTTMKTKIQTTSSTKVKTSTGSRGTKFLILFMRNYKPTGDLTIYITTDKETEVEIRSSQNLNANIKSSVDRTINIASSSMVTLPHDLTCGYMEIEPKGLILQTSELSTVTIFDSLFHDTNDETLIIPTNKLSTKYIVSSTEPWDTQWDFSQFAFGALYDETTVNVFFKMNDNSRVNLFGRTYGNGDVFSINLQRLETFQIRHTTDLSGTFITSTKGIPVFSGNRCQKLDSRAGCDHMLTQLPPTNELDYQYIVPPFYNNARTLIQVISENMTFVKHSTGNKLSRFRLNRKEFKNLTVASNETTVLVSEKPILVTGFAMGSHTYDCYMTVIPGVNQFVDYYKITIPDGYKENFISVILPIKSTNYLRINGITADNFTRVYQNYALLKTTFNIRTFEVQKGTYIVTTTDDSKFALIVYGHRSNDGYGFAGNFVLP
ncbi:uncharacterized protein LOC133189329 [Saccostrea echinata]|uniref:uncharacterized protein LOC133189329 n=1 Tax=Saccostrea echinata TaxID=191078 RepID=UPI002A81CE06|nr:uncharacterized protein LOC133189329 [Saccostrea echinata]XP_061180704.1 uncharacterized protein LOC133189329 [Saccostrea echinata]